MYIREYTRRSFSGLEAPFEGTFTGKLKGDDGKNTEAAVTVTLRQQGATAEGEVVIGRGLQLEFGGACGLEPIDLERVPISGQVAADNPLKLTATTEIREPTKKLGAKFVIAKLAVSAVLEPDTNSGTADVTLTPLRTEPKLPMLFCKAVTKSLKLQRVPPGGGVQGLGQAPAVAMGPEKWADLISFVPPAAVQKRVLDGAKGIPWFFHKIRDGVGPANLDYYPVRVTRMPTDKGGLLMKPTSLLAHIRKNINNFVDKDLMVFTPRDAVSRKLWLSDDSPLGAILHLDFYRKMGGLKPRWASNVDDGSVIVSEYSPRHWRVYTIWVPTDHGHPVSGVREWGGVTDTDGSWIVYTRAADRLTKSWTLPFSTDIYKEQHSVWMSFQHAVAAFVNTNGGQAAVETPTAKRYDWTQLSGQYDRGTGWL